MIWFFYGFVFLLPFQNHYLLNYKLSGDFTVLKAYGIGLLLYALFNVLTHGLPHLWESTQAKFLFLFSVQMFLSMLFSPNGLFMAGRWLGFEGISFLISALTLLLIMMTLVDTEEKLRSTMLATVATMALAGIYIIRGFLAGDYRPGWPFGDANYFALYAVTAIPIGLAVAGAEKGKLVRWITYVSIVLCTIGLLLSRSRGGLVAFGVFGLYYMMREKRRGQVLIFVGFFIGALFLLPSAIDRMTNPSEFDVVGTELRKILWRAAFDMTLEHPFFGVGPGSAWFMANLPGYAPVAAIAHNSYLEISAESGIPAVLAFVLMLFFSWKSTRQSERDYLARGNTYLASLSRGLEGSLLAFAIAAITVSATFLRFSWFVIFLTMLLRDHHFLPETEAEPSQATSGGAKTHFPPPSRTAFLSKFQGKAISRRPATPTTRVQRRPTRTRKSKRRDYIVG